MNRPRARGVIIDSSSCISSSRRISPAKNRNGQSWCGNGERHRRAATPRFVVCRQLQTQLGPGSRRLREHRQCHRFESESFVIEYPRGRRNFLLPIQSRRSNVVDEGRGRHDGVGFEAEGRHEQPLGRKAQQIAKGGARPIEVLGFRRPSELAQHSGRIEDASARTLGPFAIDQTGDLYHVELTEPRACRVDHVHARVPDPRRKGVVFDPPSNGGCNLVERHQLIVETCVGIAK
jgi:hypothetical protein